MTVQPSIYCAFLDLLGFKNIIEDWDHAVPFYREVMTNLVPHYAEATELLVTLLREEASPTTRARAEEFSASASVRIISDSIIISSKSPMTVLKHAGGLQNIAQMRGFWLRGGLGFGRHWEEGSANHLFVVSEALTRAYLMESRISKHPRIAVHESALCQLDESLLWHGGEFMFPSEAGFLVQSEDNVWFLNPYHSILGAITHDAGTMSAAITAKLNEHCDSEHLDKYLWSACLHNFLTYPGHVASHLELYTTDLGRYLNEFKRWWCELGQPTDVVCHWDFGRSFWRFFTPLFLHDPRSPGYVSKNESPFNRKYSENMAAAFRLRALDKK